MYLQLNGVDIHLCERYKVSQSQAREKSNVSFPVKAKTRTEVCMPPSLGWSESYVSKQVTLGVR